MPTVTLDARIDEGIKRAVEAFCGSSGIALDDFVRDALLDRLEELEDEADIARLRGEPTRALSEVLADLELDAAL